ncbi:hypothetical protein [Pseudactinotalea terrae]|uniref:hypothetical protein n=1 Tax=Pseudactinotalea terrae TaxID=1743262 RepID=UPI0012E2DD02|nr:hypothetical protein [Pseudactinotalea terrae]
MKLTEKQCRVPAGVKEGGQFSAGTRAEPDVALVAPSRRPFDEFGFPTIACGRCNGTGKSLYSRDLGHNRCFVCNGSGRSYERGLVSDMVRAFGKAQMEASRPRVRQLRKGDLISQVYHDPGKARWARVTGVWAIPSRPVKWDGEGAQRRPVEFEARVELNDGTVLRTSTNAVVARRGAQVDPEPFLQALHQQQEQRARQPV